MFFFFFFITKYLFLFSLEGKTFFAWFFEWFFRKKFWMMFWTILCHFWMVFIKLFWQVLFDYFFGFVLTFLGCFCLDNLKALWSVILFFEESILFWFFFDLQYTLLYADNLSAHVPASIMKRAGRKCCWIFLAKGPVMYHMSSQICLALFPILWVLAAPSG